MASADAGSLRKKPDTRSSVLLASRAFEPGQGEGGHLVERRGMKAAL